MLTEVEVVAGEKGRRASTDLQDFVFDGRLPARIQDTLDGNTLQLKDGTRVTLGELTSYAAGVMLGCKHEFRVGSHDTYSFHLDTLRDRTAIHEFIKDNFGIARPKDPLVAMGKFTKFADLERVLRLASLGNKSRVICSEFWEVMSGYDNKKHRAEGTDRSDIKGFYKDWIAAIRDNIKSRGLYVHSAFLSGFLHTRLGSVGDVELRFEAAMKADRMAKAVPERGRVRLMETDKSSEVYDVREVKGGQADVHALTGPKVAFVSGDAVYTMDIADLRKMTRLNPNLPTLPLADIEAAEELGRAEKFASVV
jgi:hypothetical protein